MTLQFRKTILAILSVALLACIVVAFIADTIANPNNQGLVTLTWGTSKNPNVFQEVQVIANKSNSQVVGFGWHASNSNMSGNYIDAQIANCNLEQMIADREAPTNIYGNGPGTFSTGHVTAIYLYDHGRRGAQSIHTVGVAEVVHPTYALRKGRYCYSFFDISTYQASQPVIKNIDTGAWHPHHLSLADFKRIEYFSRYGSEPTKEDLRLYHNNKQSHRTDINANQPTPEWLRSSYSEFYFIDYDNHTITKTEANVPPIPSAHTPSNAGSTIHHIKTRSSLDTSRHAKDGEDTNYYIDWNNNDRLGSPVFVWDSNIDSCSPTNAAGDALKDNGKYIWTVATGNDYELRLVDGCPDDFYAVPQGPPNQEGDNQ